MAWPGYGRGTGSGDGLEGVGDSLVQCSIAASSPGRNDNVSGTSCSAGQKSSPLPDKNEAGLHSCVLDGIPHLVMTGDLFPRAAVEGVVTHVFWLENS